MPRPSGIRNRDFDAKRQELLQNIRESLLSDDPPSSYRGLAEAAGITIPTLRNYFGNREQVFAAVFTDCHANTDEELLIAATPQKGFLKSIHHLLQHAADGFRFAGLRQLNAVGLVEGLSHPEIAHSYLAEILEPTLEAFQQRLEAHVELGEMRKTNTRYAAIQLLSPLLIVFLHQDGLGGHKDFPLDIDAFIQEQADMFARAYAPQ